MDEIWTKLSGFNGVNLSVVDLGAYDMTLYPQGLQARESVRQQRPRE